MITELNEFAKNGEITEMLLVCVTLQLLRDIALSITCFVIHRRNSEEVANSFVPQ